jgi:hypothetical protein
VNKFLDVLSGRQPTRTAAFRSKTSIPKPA